MSHLVNISDEVYDNLTVLKKVRQASYSEVIQNLLHQHQETKKTLTWDEMIANAKKRDAGFKGKKEKIDHDLIAYGVSREDS